MCVSAEIGRSLSAWPSAQGTISNCASSCAGQLERQGYNRLYCSWLGARGVSGARVAPRGPPQQRGA
eukprot:6791982-Pyramimonas_sp.AAC.1